MTPRHLVAALGLCLAFGQGVRADALPKLVSRETDRSVRRGLEFLAAAQKNDCWSASHGENGQEQAAHAYVAFHTGLCGIALLQSGSTPHEGPYADHIMRATTFLMGIANEDGFLAVGDGAARPMYGHGMAMLFLSQVYGMLHDPKQQERLQGVLTRAVAFTVRYQSDNGGWFYSPSTTSDEGSVAISQIHALRACHNAGIPVPQKTVDRFIAYLEILEAPDGGLAYQPKLSSRPGSAVLGVSAAGAASFFLAGATEHALARRLRAHVASRFGDGLGAVDRVVGHVDYVRFCTSTALFLWDDPAWPDYYRDSCKTLLAKQQDNGSWVTPRMGAIYGTAMALYALQLPYRQLPILQQ